MRYAHRQLGARPNALVLDLNYVQFDGVRRASSTDEFAGFHFPGTNYGSAAGAFVIRQLLDANYAGWTFFVCGGMHTSDSSWQPIPGVPGGYRLWPVGLLMQILKVDSTIKLSKWSLRSAKLLRASHGTRRHRARGT